MQKNFLPMSAQVNFSYIWLILSYPPYHNHGYIKKNNKKITYLPPYQSTEAQENAPQPLIQGETGSWKGITTEFYDDYLWNKRAHPNAKEDRIREKTLENIPLTMDLSCVDLVEQRHHDERIEYDGKMYRWRCM